MKLNRKYKALTLAELMIVLAILAVLAMIILPRMSGKTDKAYRTVAFTDINSLSAALTEYEGDNGRFPTTQQGLNALLEKPTTPPVPRNWDGPYLEKKKQLLDPWGSTYQYKEPGLNNTHSYDLSSFAADFQKGGEGKGEDIVNWE